MSLPGAVLLKMFDFLASSGGIFRYRYQELTQFLFSGIFRRGEGWGKSEKYSFFNIFKAKSLLTWGGVTDFHF